MYVEGKVEKYIYSIKYITYYNKKLNVWSYSNYSVGNFDLYLILSVKSLLCWLKLIKINQYITRLKDRETVWHLKQNLVVYKMNDILNIRRGYVLSKVKRWYSNFELTINLLHYLKWVYIWWQKLVFQHSCYLPIFMKSIDNIFLPFNSNIF